MSLDQVISRINVALTGSEWIGIAGTFVIAVFMGYILASRENIRTATGQPRRATRGPSRRKRGKSRKPPRQSSRRTWKTKFQ
jgi:hypothetical protein